MPADLHISDDLSLPVDAVTETFAILAKRGKGKTNTAVVMAEEMIGAGHPVIVLDPVGVWWGLRSSRDGKHPGLPVAILGGDHGDLPLDAAAGRLVADTLVDSRAPAVVDLSALSKTNARRFAADFIEALYHRNREPLHVIVDEADEFAPQRSRPETARLQGAMEDLVRRGRARGIGVTLITQRPAVLSKDVLTQAEVLIALGMTGPRDVAAIDEWVRLHADEDDAREVKASLPSLPVGTAWVWSPGWLDILRKVQVRARSTFDSSATPKPGQQRATPDRLATVDIAALGEQMAALAEQAKADDPKTLRSTIAALQRDLANAATRRIEIPVPTVPPETIEALRAAKAAIDAATEQMRATVEEAMQSVEAALRAAQAPARVAPVKPPSIEWGPVRTIHDPSEFEAAPDVKRAPETDVPLGKAHRSILTVLATYGTRPVASVAVLSGYSAKGGGFRNALSALRVAGAIEGRGDLSITDVGRAALGAVDPLPTGAALREHWKTQAAVPGAAGKMLDVLAEQYPDEVSVGDLAAATGYQPSGGGFRNALSRLRSLGLVHGRAQVRLDDDLAG